MRLFNERRRKDQVSDVQRICLVLYCLFIALVTFSILAKYA
jgi:hypothetical protein